MKSIKRGERLTILLIVLFLLGMVLLVARIVSQATFYMSHSHNVKLGNIYDQTEQSCSMKTQLRKNMEQIIFWMLATSSATTADA